MPQAVTDTDRALLKVDNVARAGLSPVSLSLHRGACCTVMGPSGAGKSILLRAIADLDPHDGEIFLDGIACSAMSGPAWRAKVTYVAAEPGWWDQTVGPHMARPDRARDMLAALDLPAAILDAPVARLSTGERQRLALIRAVIQDPDVLLLDEPTGPLDTASRDRVAGMLEAKRDDGMGLLIATHDSAFAERLGGPRYTMQAGRLEPAG